MNVCHEHFENKQIFHSYPSRKRKGVHAAIKQAQQYSQQYSWYLKLDVRKYFDSIHHDVLKTQLAKLFKDEKLLTIFYQIIDSYEASSERGVPIGNLTSQYFSNHYLAQADAFAKETLHIKPYMRYMDDIVFWHNDKAELLQLGKVFEAFALTHLRLSLKPYCLNKAQIYNY
jgi:RNA-directed DNA polymerase